MKSNKILAVWMLMKTNKCHDFLFLALLLLISVPYKLVKAIRRAGPLHPKKLPKLPYLVFKAANFMLSKFSPEGGRSS